MIEVTDVWYFIAYMEDNGKRQKLFDEITNLHPVAWLVNYRKTYPNSVLQVNIVFWAEIPEVFAKAYKEYFE